MLRDVRYGLKLLWKDRAFAATAILTLAVCIGANTAIFTIVNSVLLRPLPAPESDRILLMAQGRKIFDVMQTLHSAQPEHVLLLVGPEGDLNLEEKKMVQANNFIFCALTPTIMRAMQAAAFAASFVRSLLVSALF